MLIFNHTVEPVSSLSENGFKWVIRLFSFQFWVNLRKVCCFFLELRICLLQFLCQDNLTKTLNHLEELVERAVEQYRPHLIALPECFTFAYETEMAILNKMAETIKDGKTCQTLSALCKKYNLYIVGGSIVERDGTNLYNTATVWNSNGELIARHRKVSGNKTCQRMCTVHTQ